MWNKNTYLNCPAILMLLLAKSTLASSPIIHTKKNIIPSMRFTMSLRKVLFYLIIILNINSRAQNGESYLTLISLSGEINFNKLENLNLPAYYRDATSLLTVLNSAQLATVEDSNMGFIIIEANPVIENYRVLSSTDLEESISSNISGNIIYKNENLSILKNYKPRLSEQNPTKLRLSTLSRNPLIFKDEKISPSEFTSEVNDSVIANIVSQINPDSVANIIQSLQDFNTRFMLTENRFAAAEWIENKFLQLGFINVEFDSFMCHTVFDGIDTTTIQVNVVATLQGNERPDEIYIIGGHYDSYCYGDPYGDPFVWAPGADDDASGSAAVLESARVIMESGLEPEATIKFICFGAEELMNFGDAGSEHYAQQAYNSGMDIRLMVNNDMISYTPYNVTNSTLDINYYLEYIDLLEIAKSVTQQFTVLTPLNGSVNPGADSGPFYEFGYPPIYFVETYSSPYYHQSSDTIGNYNMEYCSEVIKSSCATLLTKMVIPAKVTNYKLVDAGNGNSLIADWSPNTDPDFTGYNIYIGTSTGAYDSSFNTVDTVFILNGLIEETTYYVGISAYDDDGNEGIIIERNCVPGSIPLSPSGFTAIPRWLEVDLFWNKNLEHDLLGYSLFRSSIEGELGDKLHTQILTDTMFIDNSAVNGIYYYYTVKAVDSLLNESINNPTLRSRVISLDQGILVVDETADGDGSLMNPSDEQVDDFYDELLSYFKSEEYDLIEEGNIGIADLGAFSTVLWHGNDFQDMQAPFDFKNQIMEYLNYGGNFLYTGYRPGKAFEQASGNPITFEQGDFIYDYLKIEEAVYKVTVLFIGANQIETGYNNIFIDSSKTNPSDEYHLRQIESITSASSGNDIYSFNTLFDSTSIQGNFKGKPVGVEYIGADYNTITLSFPLYYMNQVQAQDLIHTILANKFNEIVSLEDEEINEIPTQYNLSQNYPNPFNPSTTIRYQIPEISFVTIKVFDVLGNEIEILVNEEKTAGSYEITWYAEKLPSGVYFYRLQTGDFVETIKTILLK
jgi:hypothetical protein